MSDWIRQFKFDPIPGLVNSENKPISYFARRDVLGERVELVGNLWKLPEAQKIVDRQRARGSQTYFLLSIHSQLGFTSQDSDVKKVLLWFLNRQHGNGLWKLSLLKTGKKDLSQWIALAICRVFKRFHEN